MGAAGQVGLKSFTSLVKMGVENLSKLLLMCSCLKYRFPLNLNIISQVGFALNLKQFSNDHKYIFTCRQIVVSPLFGLRKPKTIFSPIDQHIGSFFHH